MARARGARIFALFDAWKISNTMEPQMTTEENTWKHSSNPPLKLPKYWEGQLWSSNVTLQNLKWKKVVKDNISVLRTVQFLADPQVILPLALHPQYPMGFTACSPGIPQLSCCHQTQLCPSAQFPCLPVLCAKAYGTAEKLRVRVIFKRF